MSSAVVGGRGEGEGRASPDMLLELLGLRQLLSGLSSRALGSASSWDHLSQAPRLPSGLPSRCLTLWRWSSVVCS